MTKDILPNERRQYFRIKNWLIINFETVESVEDLPEYSDLTNQESPRITLLQELSRLEEENQSYLRSLQEKQSNLGKYLLNMNKKFELLTRFVIQSLSDHPQELTEVDISGGGLRFSTSQKQVIDQLIKLEIVLVPECYGIIAYARVVDCQPIEGSNCYTLAVIFVKLREADRDAIVRHVFKVQSNQLRAAKRNTESDDQTD